MRNESFKRTINKVLQTDLNVIESKPIRQDKPYRIKPVHLGAKLALSLPRKSKILLDIPAKQ
jgi:hypothetical protein